MRKLTRLGLIGLCAGVLGIPAWADGPAQVRVAVLDAGGTLTAPIGLTYEIDGQLYKAVSDANGTLILNTDGAERVTIGLDGQAPLELNLEADSTNMLIDVTRGQAKLVSQVGFGQALRTAGIPAVGADAITAVTEFEPMSARLTGELISRGLRQGSDSCTGAEAISGLGTFDFDNTTATNEGPNHPGCLAFGFDSIAFDVWFCWTAPADGDYALATCDVTTLDTKIAVYDGCVCPTDDSTLLGCNDDTCSLQSTVNFSAVGGQTYLLRIGMYPGPSVTSGGVGQFTISGAEPPPEPADCNQPMVNCQAGDPADALNATGGIFTVAEDFVTTADGSISELCWFGTYFDGFGDCSSLISDDFTVSYYENNDGFPGTQIASFSQSGGSLNVSGPTATGGQIAGFIPEYLISATHAPVAVTADTCYWLEISNNISGCSFFWEISGAGNGRVLQDGDGTNPPNGYDLTDAVVNDVAFCLDLELGDPNCAPAPLDTPCEIPDENCQGADQINAFTSTETIFTVADDFETPSSRAVLSSVCWTGGGQDQTTGGPCSGADDFTVTYYDDAGGMPGSVIASFSQSGGSLTVDSGPTGLLIAGALAEIEYTGAHAPVTLGDGTCYWIEITNAAAGCNWFWGTSSEGNGIAFQDGDGFVPPDGYDESDRIVGDLSFCLDTGLGDAGNCLPPPPANDECVNAEDLPCNASVTVDTTFATTAVDDPDYSCIFNGPGQGAGSVWYTFTATDTSAFLDTNSSAASDSVIAVYDGSCGSLVEIACSEDEGDGLLSEVCVEGLTVGNTYYIQLSAFSAADQGSYTLSLQCPCPAPPEPPANDDCEDAEAVAIPSLTAGDTTLAQLDTAPFCDTSVTSAGVWYSVEGTGTTITASLCNGNTGYDSKLSVYCGDCDSLVCVVGNDDTCGLQSEVSWCSQAGATYLILVHGFSSAVGPFELELSEDGIACTATVECLPQGACCLMDGSCEITTASACADQGGSFQGEGTDCGGLVYTLATCDSLFEDIAGTGTLAPTASSSDDNGDANVPIGFDFTFFGNTYGAIGIASNGYLTFGEDISDLSNDPIPTATLPNDMIAGLWDDLAPNSDPNANVYYQTSGMAPNRTFTVQWDRVPQFANTDDNTFQVVLYEGSNAIEIRYKSVTPEGFAGDYTIGIENADGTDGIEVDATGVAAGTCVRFEPTVVPSPCVETIEFDMLPGSCPNILRRPLSGLPRIVSGALLGSASFDVNDIDVGAGITIERVDGAGSPTVLFNSSIADVATPFPDNGCDCHDANGDGFDDLVINFSRNPFRNGIDITSVPLGTDIPLVVKGFLTNGTPFVAYDCLRRAAPGVPTDMTPVTLPASGQNANTDVADVHQP